MNIIMGCGISIWDTAYRYGILPYRYGHLGCRYGICANDVGYDIIDMLISHHIDMGYVVTLTAGPRGVTCRRGCIIRASRIPPWRRWS